MILSLITLFAYQIFKADQKVFVEQEEVVDMQQNARIAMDQLVRDLRLAGSGVPTGGVDSDIGQLFPVIPGNGGDSLPDTVKILADFKNVRTQLSNPMPRTSANLKVVDASEFEVGAIAIISGPVSGGAEAAEVFQITHVSTQGQDMIQHRRSPPWNEDQKLNHRFLPPSSVSMMTFRKYYIDTSDDSHPKLVIMENEAAPQTVADNMENFQLVYDLLTGEKDEPEPDNPATIKKATFSIVARTDTPDPQWNNGIHSVTGNSDQYRRLVFTSDVYIRNSR